MGTQVSTQWNTPSPGHLRGEGGGAVLRGDTGPDLSGALPLFPRAWISSEARRAAAAEAEWSVQAPHHVHPGRPRDTDLDLWPWWGSPFTGMGGTWARPPAAPTATPWSATCVWAVHNFSEDTGEEQVVTADFISRGEYEIDIAGHRFQAKAKLYPVPPSSPISAGRRTWS